MKLSLKYICASFLILVSGMAFAQNQECVTVSVTFSMALSDEAVIEGKAEAVFQGNAFRMSGEGLEVWCDGNDVWTIDGRAKEVYIETLDSDNKEYVVATTRAVAGMQAGGEADFLTPDDQLVRIKVISIKKTGRRDVSSFRPTQDFDSSWVVTDLR